MISLIEALILSIVQGVTEWFPVSSSGHLALIQQYFGIQNLSYDVFLHFASVIAVIILFWRDIISLMDIRKRDNLNYILLLILAVIPAFIAGILLKKYIVSSFKSLLFLGIFFIFSGIIIYSTKFIKDNKKKIGFVDAVFIGLMQVFALFPGVSRSGMTISGGLFAGLSKQEAIKFSFLLAIPVIVGASLAEATPVFRTDISLFILIISFSVTLVVSLFTIKFLLRIIKIGRFYWFGLYDILLGVLVLGLSLF
jgi:undecaprenyl-diphosphatase